jgi:hypothetical protein
VQRLICVLEMLTSGPTSFCNSPAIRARFSASHFRAEGYFSWLELFYGVKSL